ncbi:hypothetical protein SYNPS1DRAFT_29011 [Syncephalis pseudoplumigaleata]|uniref:DNA mismatch repair protein S5 domain-containing protein n=1 Tax=Syncephalis pseudoplumigaleata TaxID=1712513 RepID=A0A4P9Z1H5_9FUNG|nr:hypothetical protein SYNPS1DRAFT_29011 [Syncephalis pseudoplumigaleata]|eukprot:RKP25250.1 hypothetical protein SYNPS1DRAFT_29011 [Syncephalis pseudoplumigaleata]
MLARLLMVVAAPGESVHALCTTSDVTLITRTDDEPAATLLELNPTGDVARSHTTSGQRGTSVILAEKQPAKRTLTCILERLHAYALIHTGVRFSLRHCAHETATEWISPGDGCTVKEKVANLMGGQAAAHLQEVSWREHQLEIEALLPQAGAAPALLRLTQPPVICVNGRPMQRADDIRLIERAVCQHYLSSTGMPLVNIDPAKDRVLFHDRAMLMDALHRLLGRTYPAMTASMPHADPPSTTCARERASERAAHRPSKLPLISSSGRGTKTKRQRDSKCKRAKSQWTARPMKQPGRTVVAPPSPTSPKQRPMGQHATDSKVHWPPTMLERHHHPLRDADVQIKAESTTMTMTTTTAFWQCPDKASSLYTRKMTESIAVDWQQVKESVSLPPLDASSLHSPADAAPRIIGQADGIWLGVNSNGLVAIQLASMVGGSPAFELLLSLETESTGDNDGERRIIDRRLLANGFELRRSGSTLMLHGVCSQLLPNYGIADFRELVQLLVDQQRVDNDGKQLFPCMDERNMLRFCRPRRVCQYLEHHHHHHKHGHRSDTSNEQQREQALARLQQGDGIPLY